jgi:predicted Zn-dependent protease
MAIRLGQHGLRRALLSLTLGSLLAAGVGFAQAPTKTGASKPASTKPVKEPSSVRRAHDQIVAQMGLYDDQAIQDYVSEIGQRVARVSDMPNADFKFYVVDQEDFNAFTTGCCRVYVHRGLLLALNSEAELAAVLGHEVGHVTAKHPQKRQTAGILGQLGAMAAAIATGSQVGAELANLGAGAAVMTYGRSQEMEADRLGLNFATRAGYRPEAMGEVAQAMQANQRFANDQARAEGREPVVYHSILSSHPAPDKRLIQAAKGAARAGQDPEGGWLENREEYLKKIEGLAFGSSKAQGVMRENRMYHAPLGITVAFPKGWTVLNQPDRVVAFTPAKDAYLMMRLVPNDPKKPLGPREALLSFSQGQLTGGEAIESHGMQGYTALRTSGSELDQGQGPLRMVALQRGDGFYMFWGSSKASRGGVPEADGVIQGVAQTLRALKPSEFPLAEPYRIKLVRAKENTSLTTYAEQMPLDRYRKETLELMNGVYPNGNPKPGQLFKVVE